MATAALIYSNTLAGRSAMLELTCGAVTAAAPISSSMVVGMGPEMMGSSRGESPPTPGELSGPTTGGAAGAGAAGPAGADAEDGSSMYSPEGREEGQKVRYWEWNW